MAFNELRAAATELERVRPALPVLYEVEDTFFSRIEKKNVEVVSKRDMRIPLNLRPGGYFGIYNSDGGDLGRGDGPVYDKAIININDYRYAVEYTRQAEWATDTSRKAVTQTVKKLTAQAMQEIRRAFDALYQTAGNGVEGTISAFTGTGPYTLTCAGANDGFGIKLLRYGQKVDIYSADLLTKRTSTPAQITFYDASAKQVTINSGTITGIANGDKIVVEGASGLPPVALLGIPYHNSNASTGIWLGFNRANVPEIRANRVDAGGSSLALGQPRLALAMIGDRLGKNNMKKLEAWMHPAQAAAYEELGQLIMVINKTSKNEPFNPYFGDDMQMAGCRVMTHFMWDKRRIDFLDINNWGRAVMKEIDFYTVDGRKLFEVRSTDGGLAAANLFYIVTSFNAFVDNPAEMAYIDNLAVPTGY
jgi:hypothetical protein